MSVTSYADDDNAFLRDTDRYAHPDCPYCDDTGYIRVDDFDGSHAEPCSHCGIAGEYDAKRAALAREFGTDRQRQQKRVPMRAPR